MPRNQHTFTAQETNIRLVYPAFADEVFGDDEPTLSHLPIHSSQ
ncbi:hypothetical protein [Marinospirillum sp.]|nr:hypothetical protein [Marinospirillum sp.]